MSEIHAPSVPAVVGGDTRGSGRDGRTPAILTPDGEVVELSLSTPLSVDEAAALLPRVRVTLDAVRRYIGFLEDMVKRSMVERGQRERRAEGVVYELKSEAEWIVHDQAGLAEALEVAQATGDITAEERQRAHQVVVSHRFNHTALNVLAKRAPEIDKFRRREEGEPRLRTK